MGNNQRKQSPGQGHTEVDADKEKLETCFLVGLIVRHSVSVTQFRPVTSGSSTYAPRLDISLKKKTTNLKFDLDIPVAVF